MTDRAARPGSEGGGDKDAINLAVLLMLCRTGWKTIAGCVVAAVLTQAILLRGAPPIYRIEMQVAAVNADDRGRRPPLLPTGIAPEPFRASTPQFTLYLESLYTRGVAEDLAQKPEILQALFPEQWDDEKHLLRQSPSLASRINDKLRSWFGSSHPRPGPSAGAQLQQFIGGTLVVEQDEKKHALANIRMQSPQPDAAVRFLALLNEVADARLRDYAVARSRQIVTDLAALPQAQINSAVLQLRDEQEAIAAVALSEASFAARVLDGPRARPNPVNPPLRVLVAAVFLGAAIGIALVASLRGLRAIARRRSHAGPAGKTARPADATGAE